jgi:S-adenosylmethionine-diacylglycerol 3-amino-3-carboxypropyl transferase
LLEGSGHVYAVDMNSRQNARLELKIVGTRRLHFGTFFALFGDGPPEAGRPARRG